MILLERKLLYCSEFEVQFQFVCGQFLLVEFRKKIILTLDERDLCFHCLVFVSKDCWSFVKRCHWHLFQFSGFPYFLGVLVGFSDFPIFLFFVLATSSSITAFFVVSLQVLTLRLKNEEIIDLLTTQFLGEFHRFEIWNVL